MILSPLSSPLRGIRADHSPIHTRLNSVIAPNHDKLPTVTERGADSRAPFAKLQARHSSSTFSAMLEPPHDRGMM
jgi:hypothetical protein